MCDNLIAGVNAQSGSDLIEDAVEKIAAACGERKQA
ncbi:MAG: hypothetical protein MSS48_04095 [Clostridiales bacterium]|nr:hypothetical protein [Clostridiales bacterium]